MMGHRYYISDNYNSTYPVLTSKYYWEYAVASSESNSNVRRFAVKAKLREASIMRAHGTVSFFSWCSLASFSPPAYSRCAFYSLLKFPLPNERQNRRDKFFYLLTSVLRALPLGTVCFVFLPTSHQLRLNSLPLFE